MEPVQQTDIVKVGGGSAAAAGDWLAVEEPLEIQLAYTNAAGKPLSRTVAVTMRTPGRDALLAAGFLFTEGIIRDREQVADIIQSGDNHVRVQLVAGATPLLGNAERNFYTTSSCGVCGKSGIEAIRTVSAFTIPAKRAAVNAAVLYRLPQLLREQQAVFDSTGGLHASALFDLQGRFITLQEDVGRHNALDKIIGAALLEGRLPLQEVILLLSGRASFELVQKAVMAGIPVIAAVGAPSSLAVSLAREQGLTLAGFLRGERFNLYSAPETITVTPI